MLISLDNVGIWNLRTENLDSWYLGQETYVKVVNPEPTNKTELPIPDNVLFCGSLSKMQKYVYTILQYLVICFFIPISKFGNKLQKKRKVSAVGRLVLI